MGLLWRGSTNRRTKPLGKLLTIGIIRSCRDLETGGSFSNIQDVIAKINKTSEEIQMEIDDVS